MDKLLLYPFNEYYSVIKKERVTDVLIFYNLEECQGIMWMEKAILKRLYTIWLHSHDYSLEDITTTTENRQVFARN